MNERVAGRELDAEVAEKVMGWHQRIDWGYRPQQYEWHEGPEFKAYVNHPEQLPQLRMWSPSTDIAAAWDVVTAIREKYNRLLKLYQFLMNSDEYEDWHATFEHRESCDEKSSPVRLMGTPISAPTAICLAALESVGVPVVEQEWVAFYGFGRDEEG